MQNVINTTKNGKAIPIAFRGITNTSSDDVRSNLVETFERGYKNRFNEMQQSMKGGAVSIVGSGPSLKWTYKDLVGDVIACNSAHDFLIEHGVIPKYAMLWDAHPIIAKFVTKPHKGVKYLVASRCHPSVFKALEGYDVIVWHAAGDEMLEDVLVKYNRMEPMVGGGNSGVTRSFFIAGFMGYDILHLFGVDCSYEDSNSHANGSVVSQDKIDLRVCGKWFTLAPWMALQAGAFKLLVPQMQGGGAKFVVHGTGLIPYIATFLDCETPDIKVSLYEKIRREIHGAILLFLEVRNSPQLLGGSNAGIR